MTNEQGVWGQITRDHLPGPVSDCPACKSGVTKYPSKQIRTFESGATRDLDDKKFDYEGFLSPLVLRRYGEYMHKHRLQKDGSMRDSDNWQNGFGFPVFMKSMWRHFMDIWAIHRGYKSLDFDGNNVDLEEALCALIFNAMGYLHEKLVAKEKQIKFQSYGALSAKATNYINEAAGDSKRTPYEQAIALVKNIGLDPEKLLISEELYNAKVKKEVY